MPGLVLGKGQPRLRRVDRRAARRRCRPPPRSSRRTRHSRRRPARAGGAAARGDSACPSALNWAARPARASPARGRRTSTSAARDRDRADPVERVTASRHNRASRRSAEIAGWVSSASPTTSGGTWPMRVDQQALADDLAAEREQRAAPVQSAGMICSPSSQRDGQQHRRAEQAGEEQQRQRLRAAPRARSTTIR